MKGDIAMSSKERITEIKSKSLREHGALNPRPENVVDELFADHHFFDAHDLVQVKYEMLRRVLKDGWSVAESARRFGFSRVAFYRVQATFKQGGLAGLLRQRPGPRHPHKLSDAVVGFIEKFLAEKPELHAKELAEAVKQKFGISIHYRTVERALTRGKKKHK